MYRWKISCNNRKIDTRGISASVMRGIRLVLQFLLLSSAVIFSEQESAEIAPFHGFFPIRKIRADKPLADGRPNDIYYSLRPGPLRVPRGFTVHYPSLKFDFDVPKDPERAQYVIIPQQNLQRTGNKPGGHKGNRGFKGEALHANKATTPSIIRKHGAAVAPPIPRFPNRRGLAAGAQQRQNIGSRSSVNPGSSPVQFGQKSSGGSDDRSVLKSVTTIRNGHNMQITSTNQQPRFPDRTNQHHRSQGQQQSTNQHQQPLQGHQNPTNQHQRPIQSQQQSTNQRQRPQQVHQNPTNQHQRPLQGQRQPINQRQRPLQGQQQPTNQRQQPLQVREQPINRRQRPLQNQQQPTNQQLRPLQGQQQPANQRQRSLQSQQQFLVNQQQRRQQPLNHQQTIPSSKNQQERSQQPVNHQRGFPQSQNQKQILRNTNQHRRPLQQQTSQQGFQQAANQQRRPQNTTNQQTGFQQAANQQRRPQDSANQQRRISSQLFRNVRKPEQVGDDSSELQLAASRFPKDQVRFFPGGFVRQTSTSFTHFSG